MNLFDVKPTRQMDIFNQQIAKFKRAGVPESLARHFAARSAKKIFNSNRRPSANHTQLCWHFQTDLNGQQYLFDKKGDATILSMDSTTKNGTGPHLEQPTRESKELRLRLINSHRLHDPNTGFLEWKPGTPQYVKNLLSDIEKEQST